MTLLECNKLCEHSITNIATNRLHVCECGPVYLSLHHINFTKLYKTFVCVYTKVDKTFKKVSFEITLRFELVLKQPTFILFQNATLFRRQVCSRVLQIKYIYIWSKQQSLCTGNTQGRGCLSMLCIYIYIYIYTLIYI
jgi:hypothetical protein